MDQWSPGMILGGLAAVLALVAALLFLAIRYLRQSSRRYRWFELFVNVFQVSIGFVILLAFPRQSWVWWWGAFAGWSILSGGYNLGQLVLRQFASGPAPIKQGRA
jgi:hypothetical protein